MPILLTMAVPTLLLLAAAAARMPRRYRPAVGFVSVAIAGLGFLLTMVFVLTGADMAPLSLPLGPPAMAATVQLDRLAGFFLMLVFLCGTVALFVAAKTGASVGQPAAVLAGLILTVVAADGVGPALGIPIVGLSVWAGGGADRRGLGLVLAAAACLFLAFTLGGGGVPVEPSAGRTIAVALLTLAGCGILSGLLPAAVWLSPSAGALAVGVLPVVGFYLAIRLTSGPSDTALGAALIVIGAVSSLSHAWLSVRRQHIDTVAVAHILRQSGLCIVALGLAMIARAADVPSIVVLSYAAALLLAATQAVCGVLLALGAAAVLHGAQTRRLDRLGGLIHRMPVAGAVLAAGAIGLLAIPPSAGFAGFWLLFHASAAAPRGGWPIALVAAIAMSAALAIAAVVRMLGMAFLGRPRTPRGSAADDIARGARPGVLALVAVSVAMGVLPGVLLGFLAEPALRLLTGSGVAAHAGLVFLTPSAALAGYAPLPVTALLGGIAAGVYFLSRRNEQPPQIGAMWSDGFAPPPAWLPFGDPATQSGGMGFVPEPPNRPARVRFDGLWLLLASLVFLLGWLGWAAA